MKLIIQNLSKTYPNGTQALTNVNLEISTGMFGLLGPNGAGKSTLMRTISTLQDADSGSIFLDDLDVLNNEKEVRKILGYLPQSFGVYPRISAEELLDHFATLKGIHNKSERKEIVEALLQQTNLYADRKKKLGKFSGGMKQRFGIAQALLGNPKLIIVDEPTAGLDPAERRRFHNLLSEIGENIIVILSTHIVEDVSDLCQNMAIINKGEVLVTGAPFDLLKEFDGKVWETTIEKDLLDKHQEKYPVVSTRHFAGKIVVRAVSDLVPDAHFQSVSPTLEDVYFSYIIKNEKQKAEAV
ncbi:MAG: ABC transporter ATP-binding protein [Bacteroidetes bacterium]|nr:ABC transporter ATP-binding protein [Bacteroidota bacterium]